MGELQRDPIDRALDVHRPGYAAAIALLGEYRPGSLPPDKLSELLKELEACAADDGCRACVHQAECAKSYDELIGRVK